MRYLSLFSGIEAASVAWGPLGFEPAAFCEVDDFPSAVLAARYPEVPNLGDITKVDWSGFLERYGRPDVVVGGSPCQSFSVAGDRTGLDGASGLMWEYVRAVQEVVPDWLVWENVPGALSSTGGEDFGCLLRALDGLGYGLAWDVLDAQFFGVAQRRRRVFLVGRLGDADAGAACEVLFEPEGLRWDLEAGAERREALAAAASGGPGGAVGFVGEHGGNTGLGLTEDGSPPVTAKHAPSVCFAQNQRDEVRVMDVAGALSANPGAKQQSYVMAVRTAQAGANGTGVPVAHTVDTTGPEAVAYGFNGCVSQTSGSIGYGEVSPTLKAGGNPASVPQVLTQYGDVAGTLTSRHDPSACADRGQNVVCMASGQANAEACEGVSPSLTCDHEAPVVLKMRHTGSPNAGGGEGAMVGVDASFTLATSQDQTLFQPDASGYIVRRLTPVECERLQGFPDGWTDLSGEDADAVLAAMPQGGDPKVARKVRRWCAETPDGPRYKACGNSMAVPVMRWIGERLAMA